MSDSISEQLNEACKAAVMNDDLHIEHINISREALFELSRCYSEITLSDNSIDSPLKWHGIELKECYELPGITFNLVTTPVEVPAWGGSPKGKLPR